MGDGRWKVGGRKGHGREGKRGRGHLQRKRSPPLCSEMCLLSTSQTIGRGTRNTQEYNNSGKKCSQFMSKVSRALKSSVGHPRRSMCSRISSPADLERFSAVCHGLPAPSFLPSFCNPTPPPLSPSHPLLPPLALANWYLAPCSLRACPHPPLPYLFHSLTLFHIPPLTGWSHRTSP
jgi:hypothetical protein